MKLFGLAILGLSCICFGNAQAAEPIEVIVLGTYHFANPGNDMHNMKADDVLSPKRQKEIEDLVASLSTFKPTRIMVEDEAKGPDLLSPEFARFTPSDLGKERSETTQIAFRLAHRLGQKVVYGIDERPGKGKPDYFPVGKVEAFAKAHKQDAAWKDMNDLIKAFNKETEKIQATGSIAEILAHRNDLTIPANAQAFYYKMLTFGNVDEQPGADLNAAWYLRNAKIFGKLLLITKPGDRVLVVYGAGHKYWLDHLARETPGVKSLDVMPYLKAAAAASKHTGN